MTRLFGLLARLWHDRGAATGVIGVLMLPLLIGTAGLVTEYGFGLVRKVENQRVADTAAFSGALAYNTTIDTTDGLAAMTAAARRIAVLNNIAPGEVAVALVPSPANAARSAVSVTITDSVPLIFSRLLSSQTTLAVVTRAVAEVTTDNGACVIALQAAAGPLTAGLTLDAGTVINALLCAVSANAAVTVPCTALINTARLSFNSALPPDAPCNGIQAPVGQALALINKQVTDPYFLDAGIVGANARVLATMVQLSPLPPVALLGTSISFGNNDLVTIGAAALAGCSASRSGTKWTLTCAGSTLNFGQITVASGYSVDFNIGGAATTHYNFSGAVINSGTLRFGSGVFALAQGLSTAVGTATVFGSGTLSFGSPLLTQCIDQGVTIGSASVCNLGTLTLGGPTAISIAGGFYNGIGATAMLGAGTGNSFRIGGGLTGRALRMGRASTTILADATTGAGTYQFSGDIVMDGGGGSCLAVGAAAQHDINGSLRTADATIFGAGTYTVTGAVLLGVNGTVDGNCNGRYVGVSAAGVTFVTGGGTGGLAAPLSGPCAGQSFCVANGYQNVELTAPQTGLLARIAVVGPALNATGVLFSDGLSNTNVSGLFYAPLGPLTLGGAAAIGNGLGQCLELVAAQILAKRSLNIFAAPCKSGGAPIRGVHLVG